jgi:hypothetical protein
MLTGTAIVTVIVSVSITTRCRVCTVVANLGVHNDAIVFWLATRRPRSKDTNIMSGEESQGRQTHNLHADTGRYLPLAQQVPREQRHCVFCACGSAEDAHHFVFDCPAYSAIRNRFTNMFWGPAPRLSSFVTVHDPKVKARFLKDRFEHRNTLVAAQSERNL